MTYFAMRTFQLQHGRCDRIARANDRLTSARQEARLRHHEIGQRTPPAFECDQFAKLWACGCSCALSTLHFWKNMQSISEPIILRASSEFTELWHGISLAYWPWGMCSPRRRFLRGRLGRRSVSGTFAENYSNPSDLCTQIYAQDRGKYIYANGDEFMGLWDKGVKLSGTFYYKAGTRVFAISSCTRSVLPFRKARQTTPENPYIFATSVHTARKACFKKFPYVEPSIARASGWPHQHQEVAERALGFLPGPLELLGASQQRGALVIERVCERWGFPLEFGFWQGLCKAFETMRFGCSKVYFAVLLEVQILFIRFP